MGVVVQFDFAAFSALFPELAYIGQAQATQYFNLAQLYIRNDGGGPVCNAVQQAYLLNLVTAHLAFLLAAPNTPSGTPSTLVGRISNAHEGSVSVTAEYASATSLSAAFWTQSKYGAMYWAATTQFRTARYVPGRPNTAANVGWLR